MAPPMVGLQMYSLRDLAEKDFIGTLRKVADIGYQAVEFAGYYDTPAKELRSVLDSIGLKAPSAHMSIHFDDDRKKIKANVARQIEYANLVGLEYLVTPWVPLPDNPTDEDVNTLANLLELIGKQVHASGLQYGYHNHEFEFKLVGDKPVIDMLLERIPAKYLVAEFDLGWIYMGGQNPVEYVMRYAGRVPLVHFKDFAKGRRDTEIGKGMVDLKGVLKAAEPAGIQYYFVEQEEYSTSSLESVKNSLAFFRENGVLQ
ncbi:Inosose dehydratase [Paenibacillus plantiphilus]|uniref:Inosose dehydratase n=1 Tax=Paenibacillus plantiphilus TaxID=2905650 RepID=A0ABN8GQK6_9BACL|nr:sugar phosphate isomerase/epimerase [Paenibacillus plantiphilus]CAH1215604.1 Inosose dehydratase [Paenibacillus plantiphilus]